MKFNQDHKKRERRKGLSKEVPSVTVKSFLITSSELRKKKQHAGHTLNVVLLKHLLYLQSKSIFNQHSRASLFLFSTVSIPHTVPPLWVMCRCLKKHIWPWDEERQTEGDRNSKKNCEKWRGLMLAAFLQSDSINFSVVFLRGPLWTAICEEMMSAEH